jgi:hypothetical protein
MIPNMGWHYLNPTIQGFHITKPPILVYQHHHSSWQLGALEWVFPTKPATPPLPGATWLWYPNPDGLYSGTNPLVRPFNRS